MNMPMASMHLSSFSRGNMNAAVSELRLSNRLKQGRCYMATEPQVFDRLGQIHATQFQSGVYDFSTTLYATVGGWGGGDDGSAMKEEFFSYQDNLLCLSVVNAKF